MKKEDREALRDLVSDLSWFSAIKTIREIVGGSITEAGHMARRFAGDCPDSILGKSYFDQDPNSTSRKMFR